MQPEKPSNDQNPGHTPPPRPVMDMLPKTRHVHPHPQQDETPGAVAAAQSAQLQTPAEPQADMEKTVTELPPPEINEEAPAKKPRGKKLWIVLVIILILLAIVGVAGVIGANTWYQSQLQPVSSDKKAARVRVTIASGSTPDQIAELLQEKGVIRSSIAFTWYTREQGVQSKLQAGTFSLSPGDSLAEIVKHLVAGKTDEFSLTFLPGATVAAHREALIKAGYSAAEVDAGLKKQYDHPVFAGKPAEADLEGYIFGETYNFTADASVEQILTRTFDELYEQIKDNDLINAYQKQGLSLYQGITLASIVQREVANRDDSKQVAQVFFKRLKEGYPLGADATFVYAAKKAGVAPSVDFDSPYNTRIHKGLTPGPISSPGLTALLAVGAPAAGDYLYFVSGDDGRTHFSRTLAEHEALTAQYCQKNCSLF